MKRDKELTRGDGWMTDPIMMARRKRHRRATANPCDLVCGEEKPKANWDRWRGVDVTLEWYKVYEYYDGACSRTSGRWNPGDEK